MHRARISGPVLDRFDLVLSVDPLNKDELLGPPDGERSSDIRARVEAARSIQLDRYGSSSISNSCGPQAAVEEIVRLSRSIRARIGRAIDHDRLSARGMVRTLRVARTIADLAGSQAVTDEHVAEALGLRPPRAEASLSA